MAEPNTQTKVNKCDTSKIPCHVFQATMKSNIALPRAGVVHISLCFFGFRAVCLGDCNTWCRWWFLIFTQQNSPGHLEKIRQIRQSCKPPTWKLARAWELYDHKTSGKINFLNPTMKVWKMIFPFQMGDV